MQGSAIYDALNYMTCRVMRSLRLIYAGSTERVMSKSMDADALQRMTVQGKLIEEKLKESQAGQLCSR